jgi:hypothetical protein
MSSPVVAWWRIPTVSSTLVSRSYRLATIPQLTHCSNCPAYNISARTVQKTPFLCYCFQLLPYKHACLRTGRHATMLLSSCVCTDSCQYDASYLLLRSNLYNYLQAWSVQRLGYGLEMRGIGVWYLVEIRYIFFSVVLGPTQPPIEWVPRAVYLRIKQPGREADLSPPSNAEVRNELYLDSQYVIMARCLIN